MRKVANGGHCQDGPVVGHEVEHANVWASLTAPTKPVLQLHGHLHIERRDAGLRKTILHRETAIKEPVLTKLEIAWDICSRII